MEQNQRYTVEYCQDQLLLQPDCPVHVKKMQCTHDSLTGRLILQLRMVNRSKRTVESVSLRISLRDAQDQEVASIRSLRLTGLYARAHRCFGDEKSIILPRSFSTLEVIVEQVGFSDGYLWLRKPDSVILPILPAQRIQGRVQPMRYADYWYCGCGMVNPIALTACSYCSGPIPRLSAELFIAPEMPPQPSEPAEPAGLELSNEPEPAGMQEPVDPPEAEEGLDCAEEFPDFSISPELRKAAQEQPHASRRGLWIAIAAVAVAVAAAILVWLVKSGM